MNILFQYNQENKMLLLSRKNLDYFLVDDEYKKKSTPFLLI